ncbi:hypothetical protein L3Y34_015291 [Caenorhabditis briggsae]|uniref:Ribosome-recycling factor, mitochondrial n=1 Tax=Caenorhabditis briggsae TaxID=6238 RepID=A0AAE9IZI2_CAEBR|nr:hypothetical protein L3Y34_015291 [Caenorhabditis briggsae]
MMTEGVQPTGEIAVRRVEPLAIEISGEPRVDSVDAFCDSHPKRSHVEHFEAPLILNITTFSEDSFSAVEYAEAFDIAVKNDQLVMPTGIGRESIRRYVSAASSTRRELDDESTVALLRRSRQFLSSQNSFSSSAVTFAKKKVDNKKKTPPAVFSNLDDNSIVQNALKEIQRVEALLVEELSRHFSLKVDIRQYEDVMVKLDNGKEKPLSLVARVTLKSPLIVMLNFQDNPSAIKAAKLAIQKSTLNVTPQQEGAVLYVNVPPTSKERREKMATDAKGRILNEYKKAINEIYSTCDKKSSAEFSSRPDEAKKTREALLNMKHAAEQRGSLLIEERRKQLLKQVV